MSWMQMIEMADRRAANSLNVIDQSMSRIMAVRQNNADKAESITLKGIEMQEQQRINNFTMGMQLANYGLNKSRMDLEEKLAPLKIQTEKLRIKTQGKQLELAERNNQLTMFNSIYSGYDSIIAGDVINENNPLASRAAMEHKSEYMQRLLTGQQFTGEEYSQAWKGRLERARGTEGYAAGDSYDASIHQALSNFGEAPTKAYGIKYDPKVKNFRALAANAAVFGRTDSAINVWSENSHRFAPEENESFMAMRGMREADEYTIESSIKEIDKLQSTIVRIKTANAEADISPMTDEVKRLTDEVKNARTRLDLLRRNLATENYAIPDFRSIGIQGQEGPPKPIGRNPMENPGADAPKTGVATKFPEVFNQPMATKINTKAADVEKALGLYFDNQIDMNKFEVSPLGGIDFENLVTNARAITEDLEISVVKQVQNKSSGLKLSNDQINELIKLAGNNIDLKASSIISEAAMKVAPIRGTFRAVTTFDPMLKRDEQGKLQPRARTNQRNITISPLGDDDSASAFQSGFVIRNSDDLYNILAKVPASKRQAAQQELYSLLIAAPIIQSAK